MIASRSFELETQLLEVIRDLLDSNAGAISIKAITSLFLERHGDQYDYKITHRWIGGILRRKLHLQPQKGHSTYVIPVSEFPHLGVLFGKFGVDPKSAKTDDQSSRTCPLITFSLQYPHPCSCQRALRAKITLRQQAIQLLCISAFQTDLKLAAFGKFSRLFPSPQIRQNAPVPSAAAALARAPCPTR